MFWHGNEDLSLPGTAQNRRKEQMVPSCRILRSLLHSFNGTVEQDCDLFFLNFSFVVQVESRDTLNSIALKFDTTPNKLVQLNKLFSRAVVPGQVWAPVHAVTLHRVQITTSYRHKNYIYILQTKPKKTILALWVSKRNYL